MVAQRSADVVVDRRLLVGLDRLAPDPARALRGVGAAVDLSANRTTLELRGPASRDVLAAGCALDLHPRAFRPGRCAQTLLARAQVVLEQVDAEPAYRLLVRGSFAGYVATWLADAMAGVTAAAGAPPAASAPSAPPR